MKNPTLLDDPATNAIRQAVEALTDEELEQALSIRITLWPDCPSKIRRDHALRQELAREVLESRRPTPAKRQWPKCATAEDLAAGRRTEVMHVDVRQADGRMVKFHCRVLAKEIIPCAQETIAVATTYRPKYKVPGLLGRIWRSLPWIRRPLTRDEVWAVKALDLARESPPA